MSTLAQARELWTLTPTRFDRAYIGKLKPMGEPVIWRHVFGDDSGDYAAVGMTYRTKLEALAALPQAVADFYGTEVQA